VNLKSEIPDKTPISGIKKRPYPHTGGAKYGQKTTTNKNTKHTIEFSNNTHVSSQTTLTLIFARFGATLPA
jgi:hypothetical protein